MAGFVHGLLCGIVLVRLQRPLGRELLELPAVPAGAALSARSVALLLVALAVGMTGRSLEGRSRAPWLTGAAVGLAAEGLLSAFGREADGGSLPFALIGLLVFALREARSRRALERADAAVSRTALVVFGAGAALGLEGLARLARRMGAGLVADDASLGAAAVALAAAGAWTLGRGWAKRDQQGVWLPLVGAGLVAGLVAARGLAQPAGLRAHLARFGLDASQYGSAAADAALGAAVFALPALFLGALVGNLRRRDELLALCLGAALGLQLVPPLLAAPPGVDLLELSRTGPHSGRLVSVALGLVALAAVGDASARLARRRAPVAFAQLFLGLAAAGVAVAGRPAFTPVAPAWTRFPQAIALALEIPEGQVLVRPGSPGLDVVTLDHRPLTPDAAAARADGERLRLSLAVLPEEVRARGPRVLFVGQLTPGRSLVLAQAGVTLVDRTAAWWPIAQRLEERLFAATPEWRPHELGLDGRVLAPDEAQERLLQGDYDLVVAPAVPGRLPDVPRPELPDGTVSVLWFDGASEAAVRRFEGPVLVTSDGLERLAVAAVHGRATDVAPRADAPAFLETGPPLGRGRTWAWMRARTEARGARAEEALARRLALANAGGPWSALTAAVADHLAAQRASSPWDTPEAAIEVEEAAFDALTSALSTGARDRWSEELAGGIARVLRGKRDVEGIWRWVEPIDEVWRPWREGALALAAADLESLEPPAATARLAPLFEADPSDVEVAELLARAAREAGDGAREVAVLERLEGHAALPRRVRRDYALALARAGRLEDAHRVGLPILDDEDEELRRALGRE